MRNFLRPCGVASFLLLLPALTLARRKEKDLVRGEAGIGVKTVMKAHALKHRRKPNHRKYPNSGRAYKIWRARHRKGVDTDLYKILDHMYVAAEDGTYAQINPDLREEIRKTIDTSPNYRYVVGVKTKLVSLPTYQTLKKGDAFFHGNPEESFKQQINPYQKVGDTYVFRYTSVLKRMEISADLQEHFMYPPAAEESETTNRNEVIADPGTIVTYGIKQRGPLCLMFGTHGFLAVPGGVLKEQDTIDYLRKIIKHQEHERDVVFTEKDFTVVDFHDTALPNSFWLKDLKWDTNGGKSIPTFDQVYDNRRKAIIERAVASYHVEDTTKPHVPTSQAVPAAEVMSVPSLIPGLSLDTHKYGRGMTFGVYGATACLNAVVTRFDANGHINFLANVRPENAHGDRGEFQMTAGLIALAPSEHFGIEKFQSQWPRLTVGQVEDTGKLKDAALNFARAGIFQKTFSGYDWTKCAFQGADGGPLKWNVFKEKCEKRPNGPGCENLEYCKNALAYDQPRVIKQLKRWNFFKLRAGIVDDQAGTNEAWVETAYVWHHIQGNEDEDLKLFNIGSPQPGMPQVGAYVWRNIDQVKTAEKRTTQMAMIPNSSDTPYAFSEIDVEEPFNPYIEYELWHGDHSFGARDFAEAVRAHFEFVGPAPSKGSTPTWFGKSKPKHAWMQMLNDQTPEQAPSTESTTPQGAAPQTESTASVQPTPGEETTAKPQSNAPPLVGISFWSSVACIVLFAL